MRIELRKIRTEKQARYWATRLVCELERYKEENGISDIFHNPTLVTDGDAVETNYENEVWRRPNSCGKWSDISFVHDKPHWAYYKRYDNIDENIMALAKCLLWLAARKEFRDALHATKFAPTDVDAGITAWIVIDTDAENYYLGEYLAEMCGTYRDSIDPDTVRDMRNYAYEHGMII